MKPNLELLDLLKKHPESVLEEHSFPKLTIFLITLPKAPLPYYSLEVFEKEERIFGFKGHDTTKLDKIFAYAKQGLNGTQLMTIIDHL